MASIIKNTLTGATAPTSTTSSTAVATFVAPSAPATGVSVRLPGQAEQGSPMRCR